jgi:hypothetical protein
MPLVLVEQIRPSDDGSYYTFWVRFIDGAHWHTISGWRYWPETDKLGTPSYPKGGGKFVGTIKMDSGTYEQVKDGIRRFVGVHPDDEAAA